MGAGPLNTTYQRLKPAPAVCGLIKEQLDCKEALTDPNPAKKSTYNNFFLPRPLEVKWRPRPSDRTTDPH
ncbi:hypothetical protein NDU88_002545 [Pleurodeles waltl]|uniref:Uncharacterized protein n=1 Tax=Pleurodeles waltl TaxID=8319 RepID=A0AAV7M0W6_PLEWA|nr:hypothetical protein NDU88_002545 [Pleurodeles waltl]